MILHKMITVTISVIFLLQHGGRLMGMMTDSERLRGFADCQTYKWTDICYSRVSFVYGVWWQIGIMDEWHDS